MRTFKIGIISLILLGLALTALYAINDLLPGDPGTVDVSQDYYDHSHEDHNHLVDDLEANKPVTLAGTVKPFDVSFYKRGTHRLEKDGKLLLLLESTAVELPDFEGKEVEVSGKVSLTPEGAQKIMEVDFISITQDTGTRLFQETSFLSQFSYPAEWEYEVKSTQQVNSAVFSVQRAEYMPLIELYEYFSVDTDWETWLDDRDQNTNKTDKRVQLPVGDALRRTINLDTELLDENDNDNENAQEQIIKTYYQLGARYIELRLLSSKKEDKLQYFSLLDYLQQNNTTGLEDIKPETSETVESGESLENQEISETNQEVNLDSSGEDISGSNLSDQQKSEKVLKESPESLDKKDSPLVESESGEELNVYSETSDVSSEESTGEKNYTNQDFLSQESIQSALEKGFSTFYGRSINFSYPKVWYFSYINNGVYGFTDEKSFKDSGDHLTQSNSRVLLYSGESSFNCVFKTSKTIAGTDYTICTRQSSLKDIANTILESLKSA